MSTSPCLRWGVRRRALHRCLNLSYDLRGCPDLLGKLCQASIRRERVQLCAQSLLTTESMHAHVVSSNSACVFSRCLHSKNKTPGQTMQKNAGIGSVRQFHGVAATSRQVMRQAERPRSMHGHARHGFTSDTDVVEQALVCRQNFGLVVVVP